jgi:hypothetical protein
MIREIPAGLRTEAVQVLAAMAMNTAMEVYA